MDRQHWWVRHYHGLSARFGKWAKRYAQMESRQRQQRSRSGAFIDSILLTGPRPTNDDFANAQELLGSSGRVTGNNVGATKEAGEPGYPVGDRCGIGGRPLSTAA